MAWYNSGNWDGLVRSVALPYIMANICNAVNERLELLDMSRKAWAIYGGTKSTELSGSDFVGMTVDDSGIKGNYNAAKGYIQSTLLSGSGGKGRFIDTLDVTKTMTEAKLLARTTWATFQTYTIGTQINPWLQLKEMLELLITVAWELDSNGPDTQRDYDASGFEGWDDYTGDNPQDFSWGKVLAGDSSQVYVGPMIRWDWDFSAAVVVDDDWIVQTISSLIEPNTTINAEHIQGTLIQTNFRTHKKSTAEEESGLTDTMSFTVGGVTISLTGLDSGTSENNVTYTWPTFSATAELFSALTAPPATLPFDYYDSSIVKYNTCEAYIQLSLTFSESAGALTGTRVITNVTSVLSYT